MNTIKKEIRICLILLLVSFLVSPLVSNAITLTKGATVSSGVANLSSASSWTFNHTCNTGTGSNAYMILVISLKSSSILVSSVTYNGTAMTQVVQDKTNGYTDYWSVWKLANPTLNSSKTVQVNLSGSATFLAAYAAYSFTDCGGIGNYVTSSNSTTPSASLTVSANSIILGAAIGGNSSSAIMNLPSGTSVSLSPSSITYGNYAWGGVSARLTAGTKTISGSTPVSGHNLRGIEIKEATVLPVELLSLKAQYNNNKSVDIDWKTASEINNDYFIIEKSNNGKDWFKIKEIKSVGNSNSMSSYSCNDESECSGVCYYKLTQVDVDGTQKSFDIISVNSTDSENFKNYKLFPNPTKGNLFIELNSINDDEIHIEIESVLGQVLLNKIFKISSGINTFNFDIETFEPGIYFVEVDNFNGYKVTKKFIKE